mgnify:FL=1
MMPFTPMHENVERVVKNVEQGLPEDDAPAMSGGIGADEPDLSQGAEALKQEDTLDEQQAEQNKA